MGNNDYFSNVIGMQYLFNFLYPKNGLKMIDVF